MSIYNSDANNSSFSILGNNTPPTPSKSSRGSRGKSGRSSNLLNTTAQIGSGTPGEIPNVVGLSRVAAINVLVASGVNYIVSYTTYGASQLNNDTVASQSMADLSVIIDVYQYIVQPETGVTVVSWNLSNYVEGSGINPLSGISLYGLGSLQSVVLASTPSLINNGWNGFYLRCSNVVVLDMMTPYNIMSLDYLITGSNFVNGTVTIQVNTNMGWTPFPANQEYYFSSGTMQIINKN